MSTIQPEVVFQEKPSGRERLFAPVTGKDLVDREAIVERLLRNFRDIDTPRAQQYALIASRRMGKTSILREVYRRMVQEPWEGMPIPIWLDIHELVQESKKDENQFARYYFLCFATQYLQHEMKGGRYRIGRN
ncbi:MAG: ATP-binding protein [candidate division KSB1 bacterium]|nr:ATP-binding protein [candidate division KSB1 bacterium]